jgi:hypothetical protein
MSHADIQAESLVGGFKSLASITRGELESPVGFGCRISLVAFVRISKAENKIVIAPLFKGEIC